MRGAHAPPARAWRQCCCNCMCYVAAAERLSVFERTEGGRRHDPRAASGGQEKGGVHEAVRGNEEKTIRRYRAHRRLKGTSLPCVFHQFC